MNSYNKYLKYKTKYEMLKKQLGGDSNYLSGASGITYLRNTSNNNKIILVTTNSFYNNTYICERDIKTYGHHKDIFNILKETIQETDPLNVFVTYDVPHIDVLYNTELSTASLSDEAFSNLLNPSSNVTTENLLDLCMKYHHRNNPTKKIRFIGTNNLIVDEDKVNFILGHIFKTENVGPSRTQSYQSGGSPEPGEGEQAQSKMPETSRMEPPPQTKILPKYEPRTPPQSFYTYFGLYLNRYINGIRSLHTSLNKTELSVPDNNSSLVYKCLYNIKNKCNGIKEFQHNIMMDGTIQSVPIKETFLNHIIRYLNLFLETYDELSSKTDAEKNDGSNIFKMVKICLMINKKLRACVTISQLIDETSSIEDPASAAAAAAGGATPSNKNSIILIDEKTFGGFTKPKNTLEMIFLLMQLLDYKLDNRNDNGVKYIYPIKETHALCIRNYISFTDYFGASDEASINTLFSTKLSDEEIVLNRVSTRPGKTLPSAAPLTPVAQRRNMPPAGRGGISTPIQQRRNMPPAGRGGISTPTQQRRGMAFINTPAAAAAAAAAAVVTSNAGTTTRRTPVGRPSGF
jgi:hypothetical protein